MKLLNHIVWVPVLLASVGLIVESPEDETPLTPIAGTRASCKDCHKVYFDEWKQSLHARSWTDPIYQAAIKRRKRKESCYSCHVPDSVVARAPKKPKARSGDFHSGITCESCHRVGDKIGGPFGAKTTAHESVQHEYYGGKSSTLCLSCHNTNVGPVRALGKSFAATKKAKSGRTCQHCHMPDLERPIANDPQTGKPEGKERKARSHLILGPSDPKFVAKAFALRVEGPKDGKATLFLENKAGHRIPSLKIRQFQVRFTVTAEDGRELWSKSRLLEGGRRNFLEAESSLDQEVSLPEGWKTMRVTVNHLLDGKDLGPVFQAKKERE